MHLMRMFTKRLVLLIFVLFFSVVKAHAKAPLSSILTNDREIRSTQERAGLKNYCDQTQTGEIGLISQRMNEQTPLCSDLGSGCLMMTFLVSPDDVVFVNGSSYEYWVDPKDSIVLPDLLQEESAFAKGQNEKDSNYKKAFSKENYFKPLDRASAESEEIEAAFSSLKSNKITSDEFVKAVLLHPMGFKILSTLYNEALALPGTPSVVHAVARASAQALILTQDAIINQADSAAPGYNYQDFVVTSATMLQPNSLYTALKSIQRWPQFKELDPASRSKLGGAYLEKASDGNWEVKGAYDEINNAIWLDFGGSFFENVYVLYHELWHVYWAHSHSDTLDVEKITNALQSPSSASSDANLRQELLNYVSRNEFLAIDQQIRLYHALGLSLQDWSDEQQPSALDWHDSYFGTAIHRYVKLTSPGKRWHLMDFATGGMASLFKSFAQVALIDSAKMIGRERLDAAYWQSHLQKHAEYFEKIYLNGFVDTLDINEISKNVSISYDLAVPQPVTLTCDQIHRIIKVLGENWKFGVPLNYTLSGQDQGTCDYKPGGPENPGNEGGHPGLSPLGFPSLEGSKPSSSDGSSN